MSIDVQDPPEQTTIALVNGILVDLQHLVEQQLQLTRRELEEEFHKRSFAVGILAVGAGILFIDAIEICLSSAHFMHWMASPLKTDLAYLPLWGCHAVIALALSSIGASMLYIGRAKLGSVESLLTRPAKISEGSVPWTNNQK